ncbi:chaperonin [Corallococcus exiguus]|uniref:chaperonin n=1 Tax=Corallococcus TaxID=83461 RepID=UPI000EA21204|nr:MULTISPECIES: chaperonin [Corallococcus]RKI30082.1 chaperonin [Corallococcus sp. AB004]NNB90755.1 chaperonin [Corallococcus exiguus]NNB99846.1 chaperonin [Corallococcus exiguus]NNC09075.1 chaperonin [Corallococcus exiguus]NPC51256.1 chaperonin [Corallococcus exiguus]
MATKTQKQTIQRKARQMKAKTVKAVSSASKQAKRVQVTLGDLIAAAFDTVGGEARKVARVVSSTDMTLATGKHIVFVG